MKFKFSLSSGRPSSSVGHSSSQPKQPDPQLHIGDLNADDEKQRPADTSSQWDPSSLAAPPPYMNVATPEINGVRPTTSRSPAAAGFSRASESMTLPPGSRHTRLFMIHPAFASSDRLRDIAYLQAPMRRESKENALEMLRTYDTVVIMDDLGSMQQDDRWEQVRIIYCNVECGKSNVIRKACEALSELAQIAATYDRDGIDIHFLNHPKSGMNVKASNGLCTTLRPPY